MRFAVDRLDHLVLNVDDVDIAAAWYQRVLGMEVESFGRDNRTALKFGGQKINLRPVNADPHAWVTARLPVSGSDDDYDVFDGDRHIGRILWTDAAP